MRIKKITKQSVNEAVAILRRGGVVAYPTETAYGLGADATNKKAAAKIFKIKKRPRDMGLPIICASKKMAQNFFQMPQAARKIWKKYRPKPVSIILKWKKSPLTPLFQRGEPKILLPLEKGGGEGFEIPVRISSHKAARDLARKLGRPITATSANISGAGAIYDSADIVKSFADKKYQPDLILDGGKLSIRPPSTIVKIDGKKIIVLRQGEAKI